MLNPRLFYRLLLSESLLLALCGILFASSAKADQPALTASFKSLAEVSTYNNPASTVEGPGKSEAEQVGQETNDCANVLPSKSEGQAKSSGKVLGDASASQIQVELETKAKAQGGKFATCVKLKVPFKLAKTLVVTKSTVSIANASVEAEVRLPLSKYPRGEQFELTVDSEGEDIPSEVVLQLSKGELAIQGDVTNRKFILDGGSADYIAKLSIASKATATGTDGADSKRSSERSIKSRLRLRRLELHDPQRGTEAAEIPLREMLSSGGAIEEGFDAVGAITLDGSVWCSGAVVGKRTVLTAAHCVKGEKNWKSHTVAFVLGKSVAVANAASMYSVIRWRVPDFELPAIAYDVLNNSDDIALVYVDRDFEAIGISDKRIPLIPLQLADDAQSINQAMGANVRLIGYGYSAPSAPNTGKGERRRIELPPARIAAKTFELANVARRACKGDSGGPVVYPARDNGTFIVGIVSAGLAGGAQQDNELGPKPLCYDQSVITRVDIYYKWLSKFVDNIPVNN